MSVKQKLPKCSPRPLIVDWCGCSATKVWTSALLSTSGITQDRCWKSGLAEAAGSVDKAGLARDVFSEEFLIERPLLQALRSDDRGAPVLLIDELDRTDEPFEAFLLELLSENQISIPEIGTVRATEPPLVIITSNRTGNSRCPQATMPVSLGRLPGG